MNTQSIPWSASVLIMLLAMTGGCSSSNQPAAHPVPPQQNSAAARSGAKTTIESGGMANQSATLNNEELKAELMKAHQFRAAGNVPEFQKVLVSVSSQLPTAPVTLSDDVGTWAKVTLNSVGASFDVIRFTSPLDVPADLVWAFAHAETSGFNGWNITAAQGPEDGFETFQTRSNLVWDQLGLPELNQLVVQPYGGGRILPKQEYFLRFHFTSSQPATFYVKLKLIPAGTQELESFRAQSKLLGIPTPLPFTSTAPLKVRTKDLVQNGMYEEALKLVKSEMQTPPVSRSTRGIYAQITQEYALALSTKGKRDEATPLFLESAAEMRKLKEDFDPLTPDEQRSLVRSLYNEACSLALRGESERAIQSLRDAVTNGFQELTVIEQDEELKSLRNMPEYQQLIAKIKTVSPFGAKSEPNTNDETRKPD